MNFTRIQFSDTDPDSGLGKTKAPRNLETSTGFLQFDFLNGGLMSTVENVARGFLITAFMATCTVAYAATYEVRIKCPQNPNVTESKYISANSDLEAQNEAMRILENNTAYRGKGCRIVSIEKR